MPASPPPNATLFFRWRLVLGVRFPGGTTRSTGYAQFHVNTVLTGGDWVPILEGYGETEPNTPILASAVPERPYRATLAAAAALALRRRAT
ncbi:MAG: hypothetical protein R3F11_14585 [Verrucomicrobiales bacterium]